MKECKACGNRKIVIISKLEWEQGGSSTTTYALCEECQEKGDSFEDYGFPATVESIRSAQKAWNENH